MGRQQKKFEKKKARERSVQEKLRAKREWKAKKETELRQEALELENYNKVIKERIQLEQWAKMVEGKIPEDLQDRINNNIEILKALEEEHAAELKAVKEARDLANQANQEGLEPVDVSLSQVTDLEPQV